MSAILYQFAFAIESRKKRSAPLDYLLTHEFATDRRIPMLTLSPTNARRPARVMVMHGLGGVKESMLADLFQLAKAGFTAAAIDLRMHGERPEAAGREQLLETDFLSAMQQIIYGTADDVAHLLSEWKEEGTGIGFIGVSTGGMVGHALVTQGAPIQAMASCISSPDWLTADPLRAPPAGSPAGQMLAAISPVNHPEAYPPLALLMMNGMVDEVVRPTGSVLLEERLRPLYEAKGIGDRLALRLYPELDHAYPPEMSGQAAEWMQRFLL